MNTLDTGQRHTELSACATDLLGEHWILSALIGMPMVPRSTSPEQLCQWRVPGKGLRAPTNTQPLQVNWRVSCSTGVGEGEGEGEEGAGTGTGTGTTATAGEGEGEGGGEGEEGAGTGTGTGTVTTATLGEGGGEGGGEGEGEGLLTLTGTTTGTTVVAGGGGEGEGAGAGMGTGLGTAMIVGITTGTAPNNRQSGLGCWSDPSKTDAWCCHITCPERSHTLNAHQPPGMCCVSMDSILWNPSHVMVMPGACLAKHTQGQALSRQHVWVSSICAKL